MSHQTSLSAYPLGSRVEIAGRVFKRSAKGCFWREELGPGADRVTELPTVTLRALEVANGNRHKLLGCPVETTKKVVDAADEERDVLAGRLTA